VSVGDKISIFINEVLFEYEFKRVDFITEPGEFSVRGGIVDVFSFSNDNPYRIEFLETSGQHSSFDVGTQLSIEIQKNYHNSKCGKQDFQENREFRLYLRENSNFIQNTEAFIIIRQAVFKAEEAFENCQRHKTRHSRSVVLNQLSLKSIRLFDRRIEF
jgi:transcription-repair coupling factor (superfamily II helicase)